MAFQIPQYAAMLDNRLASSSPAPSISRNQDDLPRPMNLRVLYTFDLRADNQCLAKLPYAVPIQTVALPDGSQLGVTNLKICLQAVLKASPEIYSDDMDYTVYAFDPSEQGTPRVGHGRLSQIIQTNDSSDEDQVMVTGVVKSNLAILATSQQVQDNLEIRLALTPVQTRGQNDCGSRSPYLQDRAPSPRVTGYPDVNSLLNLNKLDPQLLMLLQNASNAQNSGSDALSRFLNPSANEVRNSRPSTSNNSFTFAPPYQTSRPASPALSVASHTSTGSRRKMKRTASNVSRSNMQYTSDMPSALSQGDAGYVSSEEATAPKRARVMQVQRPGKNVLSKKGDLRVVASAAASVRVHQPTAVRPQVHATQSLEEPPRVPTPVPQGNHFLQRRTSTARSSLGLRAETSFSQLSESRSPFSESNLPSLPGSAVTSPEGMYNHAGSPDELGSSPPVIPGIDGCPSSPALPPLPIHDDSGFMSGGGFNDMSEIENEDQDGPSPAVGSMLPPTKKQRVGGFIFKEPQVLQMSTPNIQNQNHVSNMRARNAIGLKTSPPPSSDIFPGSEATKKQRGRPSKINEDRRPPWDKEKRRQAMQAKLENSVANGEVPPYCYNCGVIETPTWRRAFTKIHSGDPPTLVIPKGGIKEDGAIIGVEIVQQDPETGKSELFRIYKKNLLSADEGFDAISLCNPCGLWLKNRGINRPEKLWHKNGDNEDSRIQDVPERERRPRLARGDEEPQSDITGLATLPMQTGLMPPSFSHQSSAMSEPVGPLEGEDSQSRSGSADSITSMSGLSGSVQQPRTESQPRTENITPGNRQSPIELDRGDPSPVRRSLFSSPRSSGPLGVDIASKGSPLKENDESQDVDEPGFTLGEDIALDESTPRAEAEKSKAPPSTPKRRGLHLPPVTPSHNSATKDSSFSRSPSNLFKTPSNASRGTPNNHRVTTSDFFSSSAKKLLHGASTHLTPSKGGEPTSPSADDGRFSPQLPRLLRTIYGNSPKGDLDEIFGINMEQIFSDCCPGYVTHKDGCPKKAIMMAQPGYDELFGTEFPGTDEDWAAADAFFNSSGVTGFTPRKPIDLSGIGRSVDDGANES